MKKIIVFISALTLITSQLAFARGGSSRVRGYVTKRGKYVSPHRPSKPDRKKSNNWSTKGNINPYTGMKGTK